MFKNILFATTVTPDCDDAANYAFDMAMKYNAKLFVFHVFGTPSRGYSQHVINVKTGERESYGEDFDKGIKEEIQTTYAEFLDQYGNVDIDCMVGSPNKEILRKVKKEGIDLVIMGAHKQIKDAEALRYRNVTGDTLQKVAKSARCPLIIISRPYEKNLWEMNNILCGTDLTKASMPAFRFALKFARENKCKLHLFHGLDITSQPFGRAPSQVEVEENVKEAEIKIHQLYKPEMASGDDYEMIVREGIPYMEVLKYARENNVELIAMSHHTGSIFQEKEMLGSTVEEVVLRSACPVASINRMNVLEGYDAFKA